MSRLVRNHPPRRQRGISTLLISMLMLAILTVITLFAARYGVSEQRTSANEYRYKMAFHVAETGLNRSLEYIKVNTAKMLSTAAGGWLFPTAMQWQPCSVAKPSGMVLDPCDAELDGTRRAGMYRYVGASNGVLPVAASMPKLDTAANADKVGVFAAGYQSYAALCRLDTTNPDAPQCSLAPATNGEFYVTVVSRGSLTNEDSIAIVKQSFGTYHLLGLAPAAPLIAAASSALGAAEIVPNPDGGGFGVPISIWTKGNAQVPASGGASFATCHLGEWLANGAPEDPVSGICSNCNCRTLCPGYGLLSGKSDAACSGGNGPFEGEDILDNDGGVVISDANPQVQNVLPQDFPTSLFAYVFGVDCNQTYSAGCDEATNYLASAQQLGTGCSSLNDSSGGLYWNRSGSCSLNVAQIGSLERPVVLVSDTAVSIQASTKFFGIIFVRGDITSAFSGNGKVYGSVILEGNASMTGGPSIVYNKAVLANMRNSPDFVRYGAIPGSWSDSLQ